ncbi:MAG: alpha/beta fold hydrolase [Acidimicrobiia bacterium]
MLLHGWGRDRRDLLPVVDGLPLAVAALDLPGFGTSPAPPEPWGAADYAAVVGDAVTDLLGPGLGAGAGSVVLVGHSFGGRVAVALAAGDDRVAGLLASNPHSGHGRSRTHVQLFVSGTITPAAFSLSTRPATGFLPAAAALARTGPRRIRVVGSLRRAAGPGQGGPRSGGPPSGSPPRVRVRGAGLVWWVPSGAVTSKVRSGRSLACQPGSWRWWWCRTQRSTRLSGRVVPPCSHGNRWWPSHQWAGRSQPG